MNESGNSPGTSPTPAARRRVRRQLCAVMFTDIVGYSAIVNRDEALARSLLEFQRHALRRMVRRHGGRHIDETGDGNLVLFESALAALECAVALQAELHARNQSETADRQLRLRIGLHQGDVEREHGKVFGDGINVGARLEALAPAGGIACSSLVIGQVHGPLRHQFRPTGLQTLKNIPDPVEVHVLDETALPVAARFLTPRVVRPRWRWTLLALAVVAAIAGGLLVWRLAPTGVPADASIAVLPLQNLSSEPGSADFVAGLHDSLLTEISRTPQLRVISRSSVERYASNRPPVAEIGRQLNVANLLEGSVQRIGARIRVNVQLIRARSDEHVWAEVYDRDVDDLFELQSEISRAIARKISGNVVLPSLAPAERPTRSVEAYDLYLRAIAAETGDPTLGLSAPDEPIGLLERALALDADFALAHAALARFCVWGAHWAQYADPAQVDRYVARAVAEAQRAMALAPEAPEALLAMGLAGAWKDQDLERAQDFMQRALLRRPAYPIALYMLSALYDRQGLFDDSIRTARALLDIDPHNDKAHEQLGLQLMRLRRYADADRAAADWARVSRAPRSAAYHRAEWRFYASGDLREWKALNRQALADPGPLPLEVIQTDRWLLATYEGRFDEAAEVERAAADAFLNGTAANYRWAFARGQALALGGHPQAARPYLEAERRYLAGLLEKQPASAALLAYLSQILAGLGDRESAIAHARKAMDLTTPLRKARPRPGHYDAVLNFAQVAAQLGLRAEALARLDWLLSQPSGVHVEVVRRDPLWKPLNAEPEFAALLQRHAGREPGA